MGMLISAFVYAAAAEIAPHLQGYTVVVTKSTVPVGTGRGGRRILHDANPDADVDVASNPEFLREGSAIAVSCAPTGGGGHRKPPRA